VSFTAAFRVDAGGVVGLGHAARSMALAKELIRAGARVVWFSRKMPAELVAALVSLGIELHIMRPASLSSSETPPAAAPPPEEPWREDAHQTLQYLEKTHGPVDLVVVDHYGLDARWERLVRRIAPVLAFDDFPHRPHACDLLVDPTPGRTPEAYASLTPPGCRVLTGPGYAPVDPEFARWRLPSVARRLVYRPEGPEAPGPARRPVHPRPVRRVLVSFGGADAGNETAKAVAALAKCGYQGQVDVVLHAALFPRPTWWELLEAALPTARLHLSPPSLLPLMLSADLAVGAAGSTSWERCTLGLPAVVWSTAPNQRDVARALADAGAAVHLGESGRVCAGALAETLKALLVDGERLRQMAASAAALCDGLGAARLALQLLPERAKDGGAVTLRRAEPADRDLLYQWQAHPSTRRYARNPRPPAYEEHCRWFEARLRDPGCVFHFIEHDGAPCGVLRLDAMEPPGAFEISILIAPESKRRGIARAALAAIRRLLPWATLHAWVHPDNTASQRLFESAGFHQVEGHYVSPPPASPGGKVQDQ